MTNYMLTRYLQLSIVVCSFANLALSQQNVSDNPFEAPTSQPGSVDLVGGLGGRSSPKNARSSKEFTMDGVLLTASRVRSFTVSVSTLQIQPMNQAGGGGMMGGMSGGGDGMGSMGGMDGGMGGMGMGGMEGGMGGPDSSGGYGGMGMGGMEGMVPGMGMSGGMSGGMGDMGSLGGMSDMRVVVAFILDEEKIAGRTRIEVLAPHGSQGNYVRLEALSSAKPSKGKVDKKTPPLWSPAAAKLIKETICLKIWKEDAIKTLKAEEGKGELAEANEKLLKELLSEEYDTQLERQHFELLRLEERLKRIQGEFTRRKQAKDRVIDVQLGKIILEAQGILGENQ